MGGIKKSTPFLAIGALIIALLIGLRQEVGPDWEAYRQIFWSSRGELASVLSRGDPAFYLLNWAVQQIGGDIWLVNLICGGVLAVGLLSLARTVSNPWLVMVVAIPYLVIVVGMSGVRQATALGFVMLGLSKFGRESLTRALMWMVLGALFHASAILVAVIAVLSYTTNRVYAFFIVLFAAPPMYIMLLSEFEEYTTRYTTYDIDSQGVIYRVGMNIIAAALFFVLGRRMNFDENQYKLWKYMSIFALLLLPLAYYVQSTTTIDRISLYGIPLQLVIAGSLPYAVLQRGVSPRLTTAAVVGYSVLVMVVYLGFGSHAGAYLPYKSYLI